MRLHGIHRGTLYATDYRTVLFESGASAFNPVGRLPVPTGGRTGAEYRLRTTWPWKAVLERLVGTFPTVTLHRLTDDDLIATASRWLYSSHDAGRHWQLRRTLPRSSGPMGVLPSAVTTRDGVTYLGEYPLDDDGPPRILRSDDRGRTWTAHHTLDGVRHVHAVQCDPYTDDLWVTTGDADPECRIGRLSDGVFEAVGGGSQDWRAVELAFTPEAVLWGVDCRYAATNPIYRLDRDELGTDQPRPTRVNEVGASVYYAATLAVDDEQWVVFSTAAEPTTDSTGPASVQGEAGSVTVVAASSASAFTDWYELARFAKRRTPLDRVNPGKRLPVANAYAFLAADPDRGLFVNPINTAEADGTIRRWPRAAFEELTD